MRLAELEKFNTVAIQCHDNPDADSIGAGFGLYCYFTEKGKRARLIYSGKNKLKKANLLLLCEKLFIPLEYVEQTINQGQDQTLNGLSGHESEKSENIAELLITVDCQYGAGNVSSIKAGNIAIIDHHQMEITNIELSEINPDVGSCSTLVWKMMSEEGYSFNKKIQIGTALYYGLYTDTNQFSEIFNPLDMDMRDSVTCNKSLINLFRNSNISRQELETAGIALIRNIYNDAHGYSIIKSEPCDPNILGIISDFLLQVDGINTCVVYNEVSDGYKLSVRSCVKEVRANELAAFLCDGMGSGGGHNEKAGGFISRKKYEKLHPSMHTETYFNKKMNEYYDTTKIIVAKEYNLVSTNMKIYKKRKLPIGYVKVSDILPIGTPITVRTKEGDMDLTVAENLLVMIGIKGEVYPYLKEKFEKTYRKADEKYDINRYTSNPGYIPTIKNRLDGSSKTLVDYARVCIPTGDTQIHAQKLENRVKVFADRDDEKYMLGIPGDYLAVRKDDNHDIFIVEQDIFSKIYEETDDVI